MRSGKVPIKGLIETSFVDWRGCMSAVVFTGGCDFRCPFCHNRDLVENPGGLASISLKTVLRRLKKQKDWVGNVVVTGGEPTIHPALPETIKSLKNAGFQVKLDTNGSNPGMVRHLVEQGLVDYVAMDIKGPLPNYARWCRVNVDVGKIRETITLLMEGRVPYEFRMTVVPFLHRADHVYSVAETLMGADLFTIQEFRPHNTLDPNFSAIRPHSPEEMDILRRIVRSIMAGHQRSVSNPADLSINNNQ
jgi:pyruvate formate lyase activating enzyme